MFGGHDVGASLASDPDRGGADPAPDIQHPLARLQSRPLQETLGRLPTTWMDHPFS